MLAWIAGEFAGVIAGVWIFGTDNIISVMLLGLAGAITGYLVLKRELSKKPDMDDEINQIGMP